LTKRPPVGSFSEWIQQERRNHAGLGWGPRGPPRTGTAPEVRRLWESYFAEEEGRKRKKNKIEELLRDYHVNYELKEE